MERSFNFLHVNGNILFFGIGSFFEFVGFRIIVYGPVSAQDA